jgi:hypothetical protein
MRGIPLRPGLQVNPISMVEIAVATGFQGAVGSASVLAEPIADIGETFPSVSTASTPK